MECSRNEFRSLSQPHTLSSITFHFTTLVARISTIGGIVRPKIWRS